MAFIWNLLIFELLDNAWNRPVQHPFPDKSQIYSLKISLK